MLHDLLSNTAAIGVVLGVFTPLATAVVQQPHWSKKVRTYVADACAAITGVLTVAATGSFTNGTVTATTLVAVVAAARVAYRGLWRKTTLTKSIEAASTALIRGAK